MSKCFLFLIKFLINLLNLVHLVVVVLVLQVNLNKHEKCCLVSLNGSFLVFYVS